MPNTPKLRTRLFWFWRSFLCFSKGHDDGVSMFDPITGERNLGFVCFRCGRPRLTNFENVIRRNRL